MKKQNENIERLTDKAFSRLILTSVIGILISIGCLCSTTWAWFYDNAPSNNNEIKTAAECLISAYLYKDGDVIAEFDAYNAESHSLDSGTYRFKLSLPKDSASGYFIISFNGKDYYTDYIQRHTSDTPKTVEFTLTIPAEIEQASVKFTPRWGIYSCESDVIGGVLEIK